MKIKVIFTKDLYPYQKQDIAEVSKETYDRHAGKFMEKFVEPKPITEKEVKEIQSAKQVSFPTENKAIKKEAVIKK